MISVTVNARNAVYKSNDLITSGSIGIPVKFSLSADFDGLSNIAVFQGSGVSRDVALTATLRCVVPHEVLANAGGYLKIGVYGRNGDGSIAIPTVWTASTMILEGTVPSGVDPAAPTPDWTAQVQQMATEALEIAQNVEDMSVEAETIPPGSPLNVEKTIDPETGAVTLTFYLAPGQDGISPTISVTEIAGGHRVTITDAQGARSFDVMDGMNGDDGRGIASAVMNADYTLTLTYTDGTSYTTPSLRGEPGPKGDPGEVSEAELTAKLADKADVIVDTASGAIASFPDGAAAPAKDITIGIEPVQDLHGYDSPWPAGGGKNIIRPTVRSATSEGITYTANNDGSITLSGTATSAGVFTIIVGAGTLTAPFSVKVFGGKSGVIVSLGGYSIASDGGSRTFTSNVAQNNMALKIANGTNCNGLTIKIQVESGSTIPTEWTSYSNICPISGWTGANLVVSPTTDAQDGTAYPILWEDEAGTVYCGTRDVTTGMMTVTHTILTDLATRTWSYTPAINAFGTILFGYKKILWYVVPNARCSDYKACKLNDFFDNAIHEGFTFGENGGYDNHLLIRNTKYTDPTEFVATLANTQLVYELATPQTYQLTPTEVTLLPGDNNVWADTGDTTVTYRADTKLYIQKINAPTDDDMIADAQIASGKYFIIGGNLYKSTTTIPAGDTITPGTNCILTNLADALNSLNT